MAEKSLKKNYLYNLIYQILSLLTPLITTPYLSRVLGANGIGTVSYIESIVSYFALFAVLGINLYGQREISYCRDNLSKRSLVFWETKILQTISGVVVLLGFVIFALFQENKILFLIFSFNIIAVLVDVVWFLQGMEEFGKIVLRNVILKIIGVVYIFTVVKTQNDIAQYVFGLSFFGFLGNISLWPYVIKYANKLDWREIRPFRNIKVVVSLFVPTIAIQIYTVLDKTMIGIITEDAFENGYYEQAIKISKTALVIVASLGTVMIPRIGYYFGKGDYSAVHNVICRGYRFVWFIGIPMCFGLIGISSNFVPWFFGPGFEKVIPLLCILSFLILSIGINNVTGVQYMIPTNRQNLFTTTVLIGAIVNFVLNLVLIHYYESTGAAISSVIAETVIALVQLYIVRKEFSLMDVFGSAWKYLISGVIMLILLIKLGNILTPTIIHTSVMVISGATVYFALLYVFKDSFFIDNVKNITSKMMIKLRGV